MCDPVLAPKSTCVSGIATGWQSPMGLDLQADKLFHVEWKFEFNFILILFFPESVFVVRKSLFPNHF